MSVMEVMDPKAGDTKIIWDPANTDEVESARRSFEELRGKGFTAYRVTEDGKTDAVIRTFEPDAARVILKPAYAGG